MSKRYTRDEALFLLAQFDEIARDLYRLGLTATIPPFDPSCDTLVCDEDGVVDNGRHPLWYVEYGTGDTGAVAEKRNLQVDIDRLVPARLPRGWVYKVRKVN